MPCTGITKFGYGNSQVGNSSSSLLGTGACKKVGETLNLNNRDCSFSPEDGQTVAMSTCKPPLPPPRVGVCGGFVAPRPAEGQKDHDMQDSQNTGKPLESSISSEGLSDRDVVGVDEDQLRAINPERGGRPGAIMYHMKPRKTQSPFTHVLPMEPRRPHNGPQPSVVLAARIKQISEHHQPVSVGKGTHEVHFLSNLQPIFRSEAKPRESAIMHSPQNSPLQWKNELSELPGVTNAILVKRMKCGENVMCKTDPSSEPAIAAFNLEWPKT